MARGSLGFALIRDPLLAEAVRRIVAKRGMDVSSYVDVRRAIALAEKGADA